MKYFTVLASLLLMGCNLVPQHKIESDSPTIPKSPDTASQEGAQHAFFPDRYEYTVGDFVLSLPIGSYEYAKNRLAFAGHILKEGSPRPVLEQKKYLVLPSDGLAPKRHYLLLDQRNLLVYSEYFALEDGYPPELRVFRRTGDAAWSDVTDQTVPVWARAPRSVTLSADNSHVTVTGDSGAPRDLLWRTGKLQPRN